MIHIPVQVLRFKAMFEEMNRLGMEEITRRILREKVWIRLFLRIEALDLRSMPMISMLKYY